MPHDNLFNGDSCVFFYNPEKWQPEDFKLQQVVNARSGILDPGSRPVGGPFKASAIHRYVDLLADSGVDTFLVNANASRAWYPSKVIPTILDGYQRGDREYFRGHAICLGVTEPEEVERFIDRIMAFMNLYQDLLDAGVDWLAEAAKACRRRGVSPWVTIRMNDYHGHKNLQGSFFNVPLLKDPAMRLKHSAYSPTQFEPGYRDGLNYERKEVRDLMMAQIKEVVEDYDYEGLELDWWRQPLCCEPNASAATVAMISDWIREIRALTEKRARLTGRPYPLGMRIPGQLETLKSIGLDVAGLCQDGTLDFIAPSGFWCTAWEMPHDTLRQKLGDRVRIYGVIEDGANPLPTYAPALKHTQGIRYISSSHEMLRANAAGKLVLGADGIEWFNFYCTDQGRVPGLISDYTALRDIHRLDQLRGQPKHYTFSLSGHGLVLPPFEVTPQLPTVLEKWWNRSFRLPMCAEPADRGLELVIQLVLKAGEKPAALPVAFNGSWPKLDGTPTDRLLFPCGPLTHLTAEHTGWNFYFPVSLVRDGWNEITVENGGEQPITVVCIELAVRPIAEKT
ncbi:MAG: hypothetical protein KA257_01680 [Opitutaceae bacterium]|nr:hypothetical protein [Opitutaceae bacterium]MBP9912644.1 hypothetical protein [Opitutaceae bacterium]